MGSAEEELINFNASDWYFSIPKSKATLFPETLSWKEAPAQGESDNCKLLIDQHSFVFRHLHFYTDPKVTFTQLCSIYCMSTLILQLKPFLQAEWDFLCGFSRLFLILR